MLGTIYKTAGSGVTERWLDSITTPAVGFLAVGFGAWIYTVGWQQSGVRLADWFTSLSSAEQVILAVATVPGLALLAAVEQRLSYPLLRALEGYWPRGVRWLRRFGTWHWNRRLKPSEDRFQQLMATADQSQSAHELVSIERRLHDFPAVPGQRMPTRLGNLIRAGELRPDARYGLDAITSWPRLWLVMSEASRKEMTAARARLDDGAIRWFWSAALVVWVFLTWWAVPIAVVACLISYRWMLPAARDFADTLEATFDTQRFVLYDSVGWPRPTDTDTEPDYGRKLIEYLWRGTSDKIEFQRADDVGVSVTK
jgi:hypothetical protein